MIPPLLDGETLLAAAGDGACALLRREPETFVQLTIHARQLSARYYGGAVYLVGSAVTSDDPRDLDLVAVIPKDLFLASYGDPDDTWDTYRVATHAAEPPAIWRRWARDCARQSAQLTMALRRAVDFKVQSDRDVVTIGDAPRVLLARVIA